MLRLAADEDFNNHITLGVQRRNPNVDILRVQDAGLSGARDPQVLAWAAAEERVLLTHDRNTMTAHAYQRVIDGEFTPGVFAVARDMLIRDAIDEVLLIAEASFDGEYEGQVLYLPLQ